MFNMQLISLWQNLLKLPGKNNKEKNLQLLPKQQHLEIKVESCPNHNSYTHSIHVVMSTAGENNGSEVDWMKEEERPSG